MKFFFLLFIAVLTPLIGRAECTLALRVQGAITAATADYMARAEHEADKRKCGSLLVRLNTPGGDLQSTRRIVERILASPFAYLCLITPSGGHAGSAGALLLQACHVNGGLPATNVGAATPILGGGGDLPGDLRNKLLNDTVGWSQSLAQLRGRDSEFAKAIVTEAKVMSTDEAVRAKALDLAAADERDFLQKASERKVQIQSQKNQSVPVGEMQEFPTDLRYQILDFISDPELVYLMFMISLGLLYFELTHPGFIAPGVIGGMGLVFSLIAFNKLEVQWGGFLLIVLGIGFLIAELFVPSFGMLGIGGVVSLIVGSLFLFDPGVSGYVLPWGLILVVSLSLGAFFLTLGFLALKTHRQKRRDWDSEMKDQNAHVLSTGDGFSGQIEVLGEIWTFSSEEKVSVGESVGIVDRKGLILKIRKN